jgi:hypothetical protein
MADVNTIYLHNVLKIYIKEYYTVYEFKDTITEMVSMVLESSPL